MRRVATAAYARPQQAAYAPAFRPMPALHSRVAARITEAEAGKMRQAVNAAVRNNILPQQHQLPALNRINQLRDAAIKRSMFERAAAGRTRPPLRLLGVPMRAGARA
ncbi:MAG: hypothetical protein AABW54_01420, partial [Candidatus Micrarchaeota archaeon]